MVERDRFLTEAMGILWHQELRSTTHSDTNDYECTCGRKTVPCFFVNHNFSTWPGFGVLVEYLERTGQLEKVLVSMYQDWKKDHGNFNCFTHKMFNPDRFADAVYEFLKN